MSAAHHERADLLGEDLHSLVDEIDARLVEAVAISGLRAPKHRAAAFRLRFADGRLIKGRRLRNEATAERVQYVLQTTQHPAFPRLLARRGRALLMEWIEGRPVMPAERGEVRAIASFQASLHSFPLPSNCAFVPRDVIAQQWDRTERHLQQLADSHSLDRSESSMLHSLLEQHAPSSSEVGFVHGDLCLENVVVSTDSEVRSIDNEAAAIASCDGDLARTLYRWPMERSVREAYLETYSEQRALTNFIAHFPFWAIAARLASAAHRIGAPESVAEAPLRSLHDLVHTLGRELSPIQVILEPSQRG